MQDKPLEPTTTRAAPRMVGASSQHYLTSPGAARAVPRWGAPIRAQALLARALLGARRAVPHRSQLCRAAGRAEYGLGRARLGAQRPGTEPDRPEWGASPWLTADGSPACGAPTSSCDYAAWGNGLYNDICGVLTRSVTPVTPALPGATHAFTITLPASAPTLQPGTGTDLFQMRLNQCDWSNFNELNDFSYAANATAQPTAHVALYRNGELIWGEEP